MKALSIAGFDPSAGAGILNDIKTLSALGVYGFGVITALTAQNIRVVKDIRPVGVDFIEKQIEAVLEQEKIEYAKTGMLYSPDIIETVALKVSEHDLSIVVDPVMVAGSGSSLSNKELGNSLKEHLLPMAKLTTPNVFEAEILSGIKIDDKDDAIKAALKIGEFCNVIVTGGHLDGTDVLYDGSIKVIEGEIIESENVHGSGCAYSSAIVAFLLKGYDIENAVKKAGDFVRESIRHGAHGTLDQFWKFK